ncbi:MAG: YdbL family protein [Croceibacterium sp.]
MAQFSNRTFAKGLLGGLLLAGLSLGAPVLAQGRDPAYQAARSAGQVGEMMDGYLGAVGNQPDAIDRLVSAINIQRRLNYTDRAQEQHATLQEYAITQGCALIARTVPGEKYQAPDGNWQSRTASPPQRLSKCP